VPIYPACSGEVKELLRSVRLGKIAILGQPPRCPLYSMNTRFADASRIEKIYLIFSKKSRYRP